MKLFIDKGCIRCHSVGESKTKKGPNLASVGMGRNLYELCASVWSHWSKMKTAMDETQTRPIALSAADVRDIIAYLNYLNYRKAPGSARSGEEIFVAKGCSECHAADPVSAEGKSGPPLYAIQNFQGSISLAVALFNHGSAMLQRMSQRHISWPALQENEINDLVSYIRLHNVEASEPETALGGDAVRGRKVFVTRSCISCHEPPPSGSGAGPDLVGSGATASLSSLVSSLWNHYPNMARAMSSKGVLSVPMTTEDVEDLMAYVYWVRAYGLAGDPVAGRKLYESKQCVICHSQKSKEHAPPLVGSETTKSPNAMLTAIWNHGPRMATLLKQRNMAWPTLTGDEMRNLIAFFQASAVKPAIIN